MSGVIYMICYKCDKCKNVYERERDVRRILIGFVDNCGAQPAEIAMLCEHCMESFNTFLADDTEPKGPGEWIRNRKRAKGSNEYHYFYTCSICSGRSTSGISKFCNHCGAKMKEEVTQTVEVPND